MRANPHSVRARVTDHAVRRYAERALGVTVDGAVVTVLAKKLRVDPEPSGPTAPVQRRQRTCLDAEYLP
ncbi:hypothetical protein ASG63_08870 [Methylobacterium sp. Leaf94]|uniref:hypothetical protein n=1 Tax=Methylobacterium sp. Leaf94 TaxID=1736250 RepID=UPI0006F5E4DC|nr:hypothetical protein [Methylobacterium sp. Leaf94]KQU17608.1 hypothetical protein ASG63_08870 [Methylobacterium sp. Leaf94]